MLIPHGLLTKEVVCMRVCAPIDGSGGEFGANDTANPALCSGTPHGLKITTEGDTQYLCVC
jgi:hypothetical protein